MENSLISRDLSSAMMVTPAQNFHKLIDDQNCTLEDLGAVFDTTVANATSLHYDDSFKVSSDSTFDVNNYPKFEDMKYWLVAAIVLIFLRRLVERHIFFPIGKRLGIKHHSKKQSVSCRISSALPVLEAAFLSTKKKLSEDLINQLCSETGLKSREIERWFRKRRVLDRPSPLTKFSESGWRFVCYIMSASIGFWTLWDMPCLWNVEMCWVNFPYHELSMKMWLYYLYGSGLYLSFLLTQGFDVKRKDFWEMFVHHIVTISLLVFSYNMNTTRSGLYTLLIHDCADIFLEAAKMTNYMKRQDLSTGIFAVFTLVWIVTRLIIYPKNIVLFTTQHFLNNDVLPEHIENSIIIMLVTLFCLHIFWTYFICKIAISALKSGTEKHKDARSSTEASSDSSDEIVNSPTFDSEERKELPQLNLEKEMKKRHSLPHDDGAQLLARFNSSQRAVMKRISVEIM